MAQPNSTLDKGFQILERLSSEAREFSVSELSRELSLGKSMVHRLLSTLVERGYVKRNPQTRRYAVGLKVVKLSAQVLGLMPLRIRAAPYLRRLAEATGRTAYLGVPLGGMVLTVHVSYPAGVMRPDDALLGRTMHPHATAIGKVLLAYRDDFLEEVEASGSLERFTDKTITGIVELRRNLVKVRKSGIGETLGEHGEETAGVASAVRDRSGRVLAGIGVALPLEEYFSSGDLKKKLRGAVKECAVSISFAMGYEKAHLVTD